MHKIVLVLAALLLVSLSCQAATDLLDASASEVVSPTESSVTAVGATVATNDQPGINEDRSGCQPSPPPAELGLDPFYEKYCEAGGIIIMASGNVSDGAVRQAYYLVTNFFAPIPEHREVLVEYGAKLAIYDNTVENIRDIPEHYTFQISRTDATAGLGGTRDNPVTVTTEQDLTCGFFRAANHVTLHELGHALRDMALIAEVRGFISEQNDVFVNAYYEELWVGAYAATNADEYWAEGVSAYFDSFSDPYGRNYVADREDLAEYDPMLYELIDRIFKGFEWSPTCQ